MNMIKLLRRWLSLETTDKQVAAIHDQFSKEAVKTAKIMAEVNRLQTRVIEKTTTYYIARGMGIVK